MGSLVNMSCQECGFQQQFRLGQGMQDSSSEKILKHFSDPVKEEAAAILKAPLGSEEWIYDKVLGQCWECRKLQEVPVLIRRKEPRRLLYERCSCGGDLRLWVADGERLVQTDDLPLCPQCGKRMFAEEAGLWD